MNHNFTKKTNPFSGHGNLEIKKKKGYSVWSAEWCFTAELHWDPNWKIITVWSGLRSLAKLNPQRQADVEANAMACRGSPSENGFWLNYANLFVALPACLPASAVRPKTVTVRSSRNMSDSADTVGRCADCDRLVQIHPWLCPEQSKGLQGTMSHHHHWPFGRKLVGSRAALITRCEPEVPALPA